MKMLVIGLGGVGQRHVRNIRALLGDSVQIAAYRVRGSSQTVTDNLTIEDGVDVEGKYGVTAYADLDQALGEAPDAVLVCNPSSLHVPVALRAARQGCALFIEKPLSHDAVGVSDLVDEVERQQLVGLVGYQLRFHPCIREVRSLLMRRAVGRIVAARLVVGEYLPGWHTYEDYRQMYASRSDLGGGVILSQIHEIDYAYSFFGMPSRVFALGGHLTSLEVDVEDTASVLMECEVDGGAVPVHIYMDYIQRPARRMCEIVGEAGRIEMDLRTATVTVTDTTGTVGHSASFPEVARNDLFVAEMRHFLACVAGQEEPQVSIRDGARSLQIALAAKESLRTGNAVALRGRTL